MTEARLTAIPRSVGKVYWLCPACRGTGETAVPAARSIDEKVEPDGTKTYARTKAQVHLLGRKRDCAKCAGLGEVLA